MNFLCRSLSVVFAFVARSAMIHLLEQIANILYTLILLLDAKIVLRSLQLFCSITLFIDPASM